MIIVSFLKLVNLSSIIPLPRPYLAQPAHRQGGLGGHPMPPFVCESALKSFILLIIIIIMIYGQKAHRCPTNFYHLSPFVSFLGYSD